MDSMTIRLASDNEPTDPKLWEKVQALTKGEIKSLRHNGETIQGPNDGKGFLKFPTAYANGWASRVYKGLGGKWRKKKTARGDAKKDVGKGGLDEWFSGHGGDEGDATWGDWVAISPVKHKDGDKEYEPGDIVGPCGISKEKAWKDITNNGKDPLKCMPRNKAHDMPKAERAELAKEKQKAEKEEGNRGKAPTMTPTFSDKAAARLIRINRAEVSKVKGIMMEIQEEPGIIKSAKLASDSEVQYGQPIRKVAKFYFDKKVLSQWESDLRKMTKIYRSVPTDSARTWQYGEWVDNPDHEKNLRTWEEARKLFIRYKQNIHDIVHDEMLPGPDKEKTWQERMLREKAWGFHGSILSLFERSYDYRTKQYEPDLPELGKIREAKIRRYQNSAREFFEALEDWLALKGGSHSSNRIEQMNLAGFQVRIYDAKGLEGKIAFAKAGLEKYKERAQAYAPILLQHQVPINIYPNKSHGDAEASYDPTTKTISLWEWATISSRRINRLVWVLAHEMGHHVFKTVLNNSQRDLWERVIKGDYKDLDFRDVVKMMRPGEDISDFIKRIENEDPILQLQLETLWYNPSTKDLELFSIRDIIKYLEKGGNPMVRVPTTPISQYAAMNPEEAFCEAIGVLVGLGPQGLHEKVRALLRIMIPSIRIATQKEPVQKTEESTNTRTAGILQAPPAMVESIYEWTMNVLTHRLIDLLAKRFQGVREWLGIESKFEALLKKAERVFKANADRQQKLDVFVEIISHEALLLMYSIKTHKQITQSDFERMSEGKKLVPWIDALREDLAKKRKAVTHFAMSVPKLESNLRITMPNVKATDTVKWFPVDLTGWKYEAKFAPIMKEIGFDKIKVVLATKDPRKFASWHPYSHTLTLNVLHTSLNIAASLHKEFQDDLKMFIRHELQHMAQSLMAESGFLQGGLPSRKIQEPHMEWLSRREPEKNIDHYHGTDSEYMTQLADAVDYFERKKRGGHITDVKSAIRYFTGSGLGSGLGLGSDNDRLINEKIKPSPFFASLKKTSPGKYRSAIKEFTKAVL
jgi:hypothetical protein